MTPQEFYDVTVRHLIAQGQQAVDGYGHCRYRAISDHGVVLKCAGGFHIPDEIYSPKMERKSIRTLVLGNDEWDALMPSGPLANNMSLAQYLQDAHDTHHSWDGKGLSESGKQRLRDIAKQFELVPFDFTA